MDAARACLINHGLDPDFYFDFTTHGAAMTFDWGQLPQDLKDKIMAHFEERHPLASRRLQKKWAVKWGPAALLYGDSYAHLARGVFLLQCVKGEGLVEGGVDGVERLGLVRLNFTEAEEKKRSLVGSDAWITGRLRRRIKSDDRYACFDFYLQLNHQFATCLRSLHIDGQFFHIMDVAEAIEACALPILRQWLVARKMTFAQKQACTAKSINLGWPAALHLDYTLALDLYFTSQQERENHIMTGFVPEQVSLMKVLMPPVL